MTYQKQFDRWLAHANEDPELIQELNAVAGNAGQISDRFYRDLEFGIGGLRGELGAGPNRMNIYTVRRATQGLASASPPATTPPSTTASRCMARTTASSPRRQQTRCWPCVRTTTCPGSSWCTPR